jgi:hypothetical protein
VGTGRKKVTSHRITYGTQLEKISYKIIKNVSVFCAFKQTLIIGKVNRYINKLKLEFTIQNL